VLCRLLYVLLFVAWTAEWPVELDQLLYCGLWRSPFQVLGPLFVSLPGISLTAWHLLLVALAPVCLLAPGAWRRRSSFLDLAILVSAATVALTFLWGFMRGGSAYNAYFQLWRFLAALLVGLLLHSAIRTSRDLKALGTTIVAAALVRGTLAVYFYWFVVHGQTVPSPPHMTTHDDTLLFVAGIVIVSAWAVVRGGPRAVLGAGLVSAWLLYAIVLNNRRLAWIELVLVAAVGYILLFDRGWRVHRWLALAAPVVLLYVVVGWGRPEGMFAPLRALSTAGSNADASSLARQEEVRNLLYTLWASDNPLLGTGWGVPYQKVTSVYSNFGPEWWQYLYMPHNSLLAVAVFGGLVGLTGIWLVVPVAAMLATRGFRQAAHPVDRAAGLAAVAILPAYGAQCYGDIGFQALTCALILGAALGAAGKVAAWSAARQEAAPRGDRRPPARMASVRRPAAAPAARSLPRAAPADPRGRKRALGS
jgi:hypothetical protein